MSKDFHQYTNYHLEPGGLAKLDFIVDFIKEKFNDKKIAILDVGCGSGNIALPLASLGYQIIAIDEDREAIKNVKEKNQFSNLFLNNIKFEDYDSRIATRESRLANFDLIIMSEFLEHTTQPIKALEKAKLLLKDNGLLIITIPNGWSFEEVIRRLFLSNKLLIKLKKLFKKELIEKEIQTPAQSPHLHFWSLAKVTRLIKSAGFNILDKRVYASIFKEFYYILGRIFIKRGSKLFNFINKIDGKLSEIIPVVCGSNWLIFVKKKL